jgi:hypothetical protein
MDIPMYEFQDVVVPNSFQNVEATAVNTLLDRVQVAGYSTSGDLPFELSAGQRDGHAPNGSDMQAFLWTRIGAAAPQVILLDNVDGIFNQALGINSVFPSTVVGWSSGDDLVPHPIYWDTQGPGVHPWDTVVGQFRAVNSQNYIAGWRQAGSVRHAIVFTPNHVFVDLGPAGEQWEHEAFAINDHGLVAGWTTFFDDVQKACIWDVGVNYENLFNPVIYRPMEMAAAVGVTSAAYDINSDGEIIAFGRQSAQFTSAFQTNKFGIRRWPDPGHTGSPQRYVFSAYSPIIPYGINHSGFIVGNAGAVANSTMATERLAFVCVAGPDADAADLNFRLSAGTGGGWKLLRANKINDRGQIVGYGRRPGGGDFGAYLLTPS